VTLPFTEHYHSVFGFGTCFMAACRPVQDKDASTWEFKEGLIPSMKATADRSVRMDVHVEPGEEGPIPALDEFGLSSHLGLSYTEIIQNARLTPSIARTFPSFGISLVLNVAKCLTDT
jgi:hypothetical protein